LISVEESLIILPVTKKILKQREISVWSCCVIKNNKEKQKKPLYVISTQEERAARREHLRSATICYDGVFEIISYTI